MTIIPEALLQAIRAAQHVAVLTGAGISAESGVPTFREAQTGLWAQYDPTELATPAAFKRNPRLVWDWYAWRRELVSAAQPNAGHLALVQLEQHIPRFTLITQNVDGLHRRAGSERVIELHGNLFRFICEAHHHPVTDWKGDQRVPPHCAVCGSLVRPDVVWFGEPLPADALREALAAARSADVFLTIGTSGVVQPAASLPAEAAAAGAILVEINPDETPLSRTMDYQLRGAAGDILPALVGQVW